MSPEAVAAREKAKLEMEDGRRKRRRKGTGVHHSAVILEDEEVKNALRMHRGHISNAAKYLGIHPNNFRKKVMEKPELKEFYKDLREEFIDTAETQLMRLVEEGNLGAVIFTLKTLGRNRGYQEKQTLEHELAQTPGSAAGLIAAMRQGASEEKETEEEAIEVDVKILETDYASD